MSKFFRKSKKTFAVLLTIAFVLSMVAVPAFAATTYSSLTVPTVEDDDDQRLGVFSIKVDPVAESPHEALLEVEDGWDIKSITVARIVYDDQDPIIGGSIPAGILTVNGVDFSAGEVGEELFFAGTFEEDSYDSLIIWLDTEALGVTESVEVWLQLRVDVEDTGDIRAYFENLQGQLVDGNVLIGRARGGELQVIVRDFTSFVDDGPVELRITEDLRGTWNDEDELRLRLPRHFGWMGVETEDTLEEIDGIVVFGDLLAENFEFRLANNDRDLFIKLTEGTASSTQRTRIDFTVFVEVVDDERASKGDIVATTGGDYDVTPDELIVGVFGDYDIEVFAGDPETVYAGQTGQDIATITIEEDVATTIIAGRTVTFTLPDWAAWVEPEDDDLTFSHRGVFLDYRDLRRDNRQMRFDVRPDTTRTDPASVELEDLEIMLNTNARGDVVVEVGGTAGVFGEVVVAEAVAAATMEVPEPTYIERDARNQPLGDIYITEAKAGMFSDDGWLDVHLGAHMEWEGGYTVEVVEGDLEVGQAARRPGNQTLRIPISVQSDEASTIKISGSAIAYMSALRGPSTVVLLRTSSAVVDDDVLNGYEQDLHGFGTDIPHVASATVTNIEVAPPAPAVVMMWIGSTAYTVDGEAATMDVAPFIENDRTFVPVRFIAEALGAEADWGPEDGLTEWVTLTKGDMVVTLTIGSNIITVVDGEETYTVMSDVAAQIVNDRTFLPARAVGEIFGSVFDWGPKDALTEWVSFTLP